MLLQMREVAGMSPETSEIATSRRGEIVLLVAGGTLAERVQRHLAARFPSLVVLQEQPETRWQIIRRRLRLLGPMAVLGQTLAFFAIRMNAGRARQRAEEIEAADPLPAATAAPRVIQVGTVNSKRCRRALQLIRPRAVAVYGTRIIRQATLDCIDAPFINYHAGINPKYRGQHPAYWALAAGDAANAGVTVHLVDKGVDTGDVLYQAGVEYSPRDTIATYQAVQLATGVELLSRALDDALNDRLRTHRVGLPSKQWFPPTIWQYVWNGAVKGVW